MSDFASNNPIRRALALLGVATSCLVWSSGCGDNHGGRAVAQNVPAPTPQAGPTDTAPTPHTVPLEPWGTVEGRASWAGADAQAKMDPANVTKDPAECLKNGPILKQDYVVNPNNKGVRWVVVWLVDADDITRPLPIHPDLISSKETKVVLDQPCCMFEPHVVCLREGQTLAIKNSGGVAHNTKCDSPGDNPSFNPLIPAGGSADEDGWKATTSPPWQISCGIHGWMGAWVRVFNHPYFAVTDEDGKFKIEKAPAGKFHIVAWQESIGYLDKGLKKGDPVEIKAGGVTQVNFEVKPRE